MLQGRVLKFRPPVGCRHKDKDYAPMRFIPNPEIKFFGEFSRPSSGLYMMRAEMPTRNYRPRRNFNMEIRKIWQWFTEPPVDGPASIIFLRIMAGGVFFWEGILKFVFANEGVRPVHKIRNTFSGIYRELYRRARNSRRHTFAHRFYDTLYFICFHRRNDRRYSLNKDHPLPRHLSAAAPAGPAADRLLGRPARDTLRLRSDPDLNIPPHRRRRPALTRRLFQTRPTASPTPQQSRCPFEPSKGSRTLHSTTFGFLLSKRTGPQILNTHY